MAAQLFDPSTMQAGNNLAKAIDNVVKNRFAQEELDQKVRIEEQNYQQQGAQNERMFKVAELSRTEANTNAQRLYDQQAKQGQAEVDSRLLERQTELAHNTKVLEGQVKDYNELYQQGIDAKTRGDQAALRDITVKQAQLAALIEEGLARKDKSDKETLATNNLLERQEEAGKSLLSYMGDPGDTSKMEKKLQIGFDALKLPNNQIVGSILEPGLTRTNATKVLNMMLNMVGSINSQTALKGFENWSLKYNLPGVMQEASEAGWNGGEENEKLVTLMTRVTKAFEDKRTTLELAIEGTKPFVNPLDWFKALQSKIGQESNITPITPIPPQ